MTLVHAAALVLSAGLFLWMFLAAATLEDRFLAGHVAPEVRDLAFAFASDWRHGMAGNSPLYMPGFFALAGAAWLWAERRPPGRLLTEGGALIAVALASALAATDAGAMIVAAAFTASTGVAIPMTGARSSPSLPALFAGIYTTITWMSFVCGCRLALSMKSWRPLAPAAVFSVMLYFVRTWTVDDFTTLWLQRAGNGDPDAVGSLIAIPATAWVLLTHHRRQRSHSAANTLRTGEVNVPPTSTSAETSRMPQ